MLAAVRNSIASAILQSARTASRGAVRLTRAPLQTRPLCTASSALNVAQDSTVQDTAAPAAKPRKLRRIGRTIGNYFAPKLVSAILPSLVGKTVLLTTGIGAAASLYSLQKGFGGWYNTWDAGARFFRTMYNVRIPICHLCITYSHNIILVYILGCRYYFGLQTD